ncbi:hypothetical protein V2W45_1249586, partial [Cenococcum geophilum]
AIILGDFNTKVNIGNENMRGLIRVDKNIQYFSLVVYLLTNSMLDIKKATKIAKLFQNRRSLQLLKSLLLI